MKSSILAMGLALAQVYANIPVKPHAMRCGDGVATCLSEAIPCDRNKYVFSIHRVACLEIIKPVPSDVSSASGLLATSILNLSAEATSSSPRSFKPAHLFQQTVRAAHKLGALSVIPTPPATRAPAAPNTAIAETPKSIAAPGASLAAQRLHHQPAAVLTGQTVVAALPNSAERLALGLHMEPVALHMATAVKLTVIVVQAA